MKRLRQTNIICVYFNLMQMITMYVGNCSIIYFNVNNLLFLVGRRLTYYAGGCVGIRNKGVIMFHCFWKFRFFERKKIQTKLVKVRALQRHCHKNSYSESGNLSQLKTRIPVEAECFQQLKIEFNEKLIRNIVTSKQNMKRIVSLVFSFFFFFLLAVCHCLFVST